MEKKEKKSKRISTVWIIVIAVLLFYIPTLIVVFHYSKKGGLAYMIGFPLLFVLPVCFIIWRLTRNSGNTVIETVKESTKDSGKTADVKDVKAKDATKTIVVEKKGDSGKKWYTPFTRLFGLLFFLFMTSIVIYYIIGSEPLNNMTNGKGVGGVMRLAWQGLFKHNPTVEEKSLASQEEANRHEEKMKTLQIQEDALKRVKKRTIFGTSYVDDNEQQTQKSNTNAQNQQPPAQGTSQQNSYYQQQNGSSYGQSQAAYTVDGNGNVSVK